MERPIQVADPFSRLVDELLFSVAFPNIKNAQTREKVGIAQYNIARLSVAARLAELETGEIPSQASKFVPVYLPEEPREPQR